MCVCVCVAVGALALSVGRFYREIKRKNIAPVQGSPEKDVTPSSLENSIGFLMADARLLLLATKSHPKASVERFDRGKRLQDCLREHLNRHLPFHSMTLFELYPPHSLQGSFYFKAWAKPSKLVVLKEKDGWREWMFSWLVTGF